MTLKSINALCADSSGVSRKKITYSLVSGLILDVVESTLSTSSDIIYDDDCLLFAGMGDIHIHAREDLSGHNCYKEDFTSASLAALNGGVVHVADMPNNPLPPICDESYIAKTRLSFKVETPFLMYAGIGPKTRPLSFRVPYKVYMGPSIGDLFFKNDQELEDVLSFYQGRDISFHCEDPVELEKNATQSDHFSKRPVNAEIMATHTALKLTEKFNLKAKLCHYSAKEGLLAIKEAKKKGISVTCEVTPQHLFFSEELIRTFSKQKQITFQMNPPIRTEDHQEALLQALREGNIDYLATDHAPHSPEEKMKGTSGLTGLDTYAAFVTWLLLKKNISPQTIATVCSENPGLFFNQFLPTLYEHIENYPHYGLGFGFLKKDFSASFTVLDLKNPITITASMLKTKAGASPFEGVTFPGSLRAVYLKGKPL